VLLRAVRDRSLERSKERDAHASTTAMSSARRSDAHTRFRPLIRALDTAVRPRAIERPMQQSNEQRMYAP